MFLHIEVNKIDNHPYHKVYTRGGAHKRKIYNVSDDTKYNGGRKETEEIRRVGGKVCVCKKQFHYFKENSKNLAEKVTSEL